MRSLLCSCLLGCLLSGCSSHSAIPYSLPKSLISVTLELDRDDSGEIKDVRITHQSKNIPDPSAPRLLYVKSSPVHASDNHIAVEDGLLATVTTKEEGKGGEILNNVAQSLVNVGKTVALIQGQSARKEETTPFLNASRDPSAAEIRELLNRIEGDVFKLVYDPAEHTGCKGTCEHTCGSHKISLPGTGDALFLCSGAKVFGLSTTDQKCTGKTGCPSKGKRDIEGKGGVPEVSTRTLTSAIAKTELFVSLAELHAIRRSEARKQVALQQRKVEREIDAINQRLVRLIEPGCVDPEAGIQLGKLLPSTEQFLEPVAQCSVPKGSPPNAFQQAIQLTAIAESLNSALSSGSSLQAKETEIAKFIASGVDSEKQQRFKALSDHHQSTRKAIASNVSACATSIIEFSNSIAAVRREASSLVDMLGTYDDICTLGWGSANAKTTIPETHKTTTPTTTKTKRAESLVAAVSQAVPIVNTNFDFNIPLSRAWIGKTESTLEFSDGMLVDYRQKRPAEVAVMVDGVVTTTQTIYDGVVEILRTPIKIFAIEKDKAQAEIDLRQKQIELEREEVGLKLTQQQADSYSESQSILQQHQLDKIRDNPEAFLDQLNPTDLNTLLGITNNNGDGGNEGNADGEDAAASDSDDSESDDEYSGDDRDTADDESNAKTSEGGVGNE